MKKHQNRTESLLKRIEDQKFTFLIGFLSLFSIILFRNILESAFEGSQILGFSPLNAHSFYMIFVHFPLFYFSLFLWIFLVYTLFLRENWINVIKFLLLGMAVITITPFIDIVVSKGSGFKLTYLRGFEQFTEIHKIFDFTKDLIQASWGQRIEILLVLTGSFVYVFIKSRNFFKSFFVTVFIYLIIFLHGIIPNTIAKIPSYLGAKTLHFRTIITNGILPIDSQNYATIFSVLIILAGFLIFYRNKKLFNKIIFNFRASFPVVLSLCIGILLSSVLISRYYSYIFYSPVSYFIFLLAVFSLTFSSSAVSLKPTSTEFQIAAIAAVLFSISLGPAFLLFNTLFFTVKKYLRPKWLSIIPGFLAGFFLVYQGNSLKTINPIHKYSIELRGRKLAGWCYFLNKEYDKALEQYKRASSLEENDELLKRLGQCYLNLGDMRRGIETLENIAIPDYETILSLAQVYSQKGEDNMAIETYNMGIERNIEPAEFYIKIAQITARRGDKKTLDALLEKSLAYGNPRYKILQIRGDYYLGKGNIEKALAMYMKAVYYNSRAVKALAGIGIIYYNQGKMNLAEKQFKHALTIEPDNDALINNLGVLYLVTKKHSEAEQLFRKSIRKNPNQTEAYFNLGLIYEQFGRINDAVTMYKKVLQVNQSNIPARERIEELTQ